MTKASHSIVGSYARTTRDITVTVEPIYLEAQSTPERSHYVWAYRVNIANGGSETVQLMTRHWQITDSSGRTEEVRGEGVVGEQPILKPGESFEYTSGTTLGTPTGIMVGSYQMETQWGERFDVAVPAFSLDSPHHKTRLH